MKKIRSVAYPSIDLESAIKVAEKIKDNAGPGPYSREHAATSAGYSSISGASTSAIAALVHYGLFDRKGNTYQPSKLLDQILIPESEETKKIAIIDSAKNPKLFMLLINDFKNQSLPKQLAATLFHKYSITEKASSSVAKDVFKTMEFAGLLKNGVITSEVDSSSTQNLKTEPRLVTELPSENETDAQFEDKSPYPTMAHNSKKNIIPQFNFNIQIQIPDNSSPETYDAIFKSISENLINKIEG